MWTETRDCSFLRIYGVNENYLEKLEEELSRLKKEVQKRLKAKHSPLDAIPVLRVASQRSKT
jgi:hypothetical protein